jgi:outer membrane protein OmpA-like peptidoglycan-associated protein
MKRLLNTTTAFSMAFATIPPLPSYAQTVLDIEGQSVICLTAKAQECPDGDLCVVARKPENCERFATQAVRAVTQGLIPATGVVDLDAAKAALDAAKADADAAVSEDAGAAQAETDAAAQAEADAAAQAEADAAAKAAAKAEREAAKAAAAQAEAEAAAQAEAEAAAQAEADAAAQAEAEAAAKAEAEAATQAEADAAAQAEAEAAAKAEAEAAAAEEAARAAAEDAARLEAEAAAKAEAEAAQADAQSTEDVAKAEAEAAAAEAAAQAALEAAAADEAADPASFPTLNIDGQKVICLPSKAAICPEGEFCVVAKIQENCEPNALKALAKAQPVEVPDVPEEAEEALEDALGEPTEGPDTSPQAGDQGQADEETVVTEEVITDEDVRGSGEEFDEPPTEVAPGKKSGLSDLEKVGLLALGALAVGSIINSNKEVVSNSGDRVVVRQPDGSYVIYKDDDALLREPGNTVRTETYRDGSTRTIVTREDGTQIVTVRDATGRVLRRSAFDQQGREIVLINDMQAETPVIVSQLPRPTGTQITASTMDDDAELQLRLAALEAERLGRTFSLRQVREIPEVRALAATIAVDNITFDTGSAAIRASEAEKLTQIGALMTDLIRKNPGEIFLIEGHTDAVGSAASNLALSDRRAESVAKALTEYFDVPPENLVVQGYGESDLLVPSEGDERANRRAAVRIITPLLTVAQN